ncbi:hypothetical protein EUTSA_v10019567mg, partial [Eutrema salsugineum]
MDRISGLPDELLVKVLLFLPTKVAVSTSILSKRWERVWMWLPKIKFTDRDYSESECNRLRCFLDRNLPLHKALVIETLRLKFSKLHCKPEDIKLWVVIAVSLYLRKLDLSYSSYLDNDKLLPSSLFTCRSLVILKIKGKILLDVPRMACLPSLETLQLHRVIYFNEASLQRLLSSCPVLKALLVNFCGSGTMRKFTVIVPSLQILSLYIPDDGAFDGFDYNGESHYCLIENMPKLREADVDVVFPNIKSLIESITSIKRITICSFKAVYGEGLVFNQLQHLKICLCSNYSGNLIVRFLKHSPNLRVLDLFIMGGDHQPTDMFSWDQPSNVPECVLSSLQIFNWSGYKGEPKERDLAVYILKNACRLMTFTIS